MGGCIASCMSMMSSEVPHKKLIETQSVKHHTVEVRDGDGPGESRVHRTASIGPDEDLAKRWSSPENATLVGFMKATCAARAKLNAMAWRPIDHVEKVETVDDKGFKKVLEVTHLKPTQYLTYEAMWKTVVAFGNGLEEIGCGPGSKVGIYEETRKEWMISCNGMWARGIIPVTVYANLGEDALTYATNEAQLQGMVLNGKSINKFVTLCKKAGIKPPKLIYTDTVPAGVDVSDLDVISWEKVVEIGLGIEEKPFPRETDTLALIMYTSGTTGDPKGVMTTHANLVAASMGILKRLESFFSVQQDETYVCYLPLAHTFEFIVENTMIQRGALLGYGTPRTLTNTTAKPHGDLEEYKPHFFIGVPRIFDTIKKAIEAKLPPSGVKRAVFDRAYEDRRIALQKGLDTPSWNEKVFTNTRALLGGRALALVSGGGPLSAKLQEFMLVVFGCSVLQGYGLTETVSSCTVQPLWTLETDNVGQLLGSVEVKLRDAMDWRCTDPNPRGEICIKGPVVTKGYYKQDEKTREAFTPDGWFYTGDVGEFMPNGTLKIIGRVKALAKNSHGEYIALESLEASYILNDLVLPNGCCVVVHPHRRYVAALVLTDESKATKFAAENGITGKWPEILSNEDFHKKAAVSMAATAKAQGRKAFEFVKFVHVLNDEWTPENDVLTAAMKLKRRVIDQKYADIITKLFELDD